MIATVAEARVVPDRWADLVAEYRRVMSQAQPGLVAAALLQRRDDPAIWQRVAFWEDLDAIEGRRHSGARGVAALFAELGAEPRVVVYDVVETTDLLR